MKITFKLLLIIISTFLLVNIAYAEDTGTCSCSSGSDSTTTQASCPDVCTWTATSVTSDTTVSLTNPLTGKTSYTESSEGIPSLLGKIISAVLGLVGSLALVMFIYGGITWMTSVGNQEQVTKGKNIIIWAAIGLVIIFMSYAMVKFVIESMAG